MNVWNRSLLHFLLQSSSRFITRNGIKRAFFLLGEVMSRKRCTRTNKQQAPNIFHLSGRWRRFAGGGFISSHRNGISSQDVRLYDLFKVPRRMAELVGGFFDAFPIDKGMTTMLPGPVEQTHWLVLEICAPLSFHDFVQTQVDLPRHRFDDVLDMGAPLNQEPWRVTGE